MTALAYLIDRLGADGEYDRGVPVDRRTSPSAAATRDTSVTGLYRCRHIDLLRVTSAACRQLP